MEELKFKGTTNPLTVVLDHIAGQKLNIIDSKENLVAFVIPDDKKESEALARLFAAAPDMLEALLLFVEMDGEDYEMNEGAELVRGWYWLRNKVDKAIKKALEE